MTIAVTGATGQLGQLTLMALKARGSAPIALARRPEAISGYAARAFDYTAIDPAALSGVETLILISSNEIGQRAPQHKAVIEAAKTAGVRHILYTSLLKGDASPMILAREHIETEAALKASGIAHTILRNGWYSENYTGSILGAVAQGALAAASGEGRIHAAARADFAEALAVVALDPAKQGQTYELAGDSGFSAAELAAEVARQSGRDVAFHALDEAAYKGLLVSLGLPESFAAILADSDATAAKGALEDRSNTLSTLIGRPTTPIFETVKALLS